MVQLEFPPFQKHSRTSRDAAGSMVDHLGNLQSLVLDSIGNGKTDLELEEILGIKGSTLRPRRIELQAKGLIKDSGERRTTKSGRKAVVWVINATRS